MTARATLIAAACGATLMLHAVSARAYTFAEQISDDPCEQARAFEPQDGSSAAQHARRACRLQAFEAHQEEMRRQQVAAQEQARDTWLQKWMVGTQPTRVINPMAVELFAGSGIVNYGAAFSWDVMRYLEVAARVGQRQMSCASSNGGSGDCTRTTWGVNVRWFLLDRDFSPFAGLGFSSTTAALAINHYDMQMGTYMFLDGHGKADSGSVSVGAQLAVSNVRLSAEYIYEDIFYTGANKNDMQAPSDDLNAVWLDSLKQDRNGFRFQVGFAF